MPPAKKHKCVCGEEIWTLPKFRDHKKQCHAHKDQVKKNLVDSRPRGPRKPLYFKPGGRYDLSGKRFNSLQVVEYSHSEKGQRWWRCVCDCGQEAIVPTGGLRSGNNKACGKCRYRHSDESDLARVDGKYRPEFHVWRKIVRRCTVPQDPAYQNYGARGIKVCDEWLNSFAAFFRDMGERPSSKHWIERVDVNGDYEPGNCTWETIKVQGRNKRNTIWVEYKGKRIQLRELAERAGCLDPVSYARFAARFKRGWTLDQCIAESNCEQE